MVPGVKRLPTLFIPHGGGPCFFMDPPPQDPHRWEGLAAYLRGIDTSLGVRPRAVIVISGHWETPRPTLNVGAAPTLLFDYDGFPEHTYKLKYPAPGDAVLAGQIRERLGAAGFATDADSRRGFDHGVFVPFLLIYPDADVPIVQMSLLAGLDPGRHLALGRALAPLRDEGVLIVGSGMSYHNLRDLFSGRGREAAESFDAWLGDAVRDPVRRPSLLEHWREAPGAIASHPREEHLIPLMVAAGAAPEEPGRRTFHAAIAGKPLSGFQFG